jgi:hypothetical protein
LLLTKCVRNRLVASLSRQVVTMLLFHQVVTRLSNCWIVTTCNKSVELWIRRTCNKSVELNNLVAKVLDKPLTTCQQAGNKQCEHILLTSCWNSIATSLLLVCYNLCVFTSVTCRVCEGKSIKILWHFTRCRINSRGLMGLNFEWKSYTCQIQARNSWGKIHQL